jgi:hypothetical protein
MDEVEIIIAEDGSPTVKVHSMLDWFDGQIQALEDAKESMSDDNGRAFLAAQVEFVQDLKEDLVTSTLEKMDVSAAS